MPLARIFTRNLEHGLKVSELLRSQFVGLDVEIVSPDQQCSGIPDLEIRLEPYTAQEVMLELSTLAGKDPVQVFVAPGVLEACDAPAVAEKEAELLTEKAGFPASDEGSSSSSSAVPYSRRPPIEAMVAWISQLLDGLQQLWWRHCLIAEIQAIQRQRVMARARAASDEQERKVLAIRREKKLQIREEQEKQAFFKALLEHATTSNIGSDSPGQQRAACEIRETVNGLGPRNVLAATAAVILFFGILSSLAYINRRPAHPLSETVANGADSIEQEVPFGSATAAPVRTNSKIPNPNAVPAEQEQNVDAGRHMAVTHLQNGDEVRFLSDDVTVRYFNHKKKPVFHRSSVPVHAAIAPLRSPIPTIARNTSKPGIKLITDLD